MDTTTLGSTSKVALTPAQANGLGTIDFMSGAGPGHVHPGVIHAGNRAALVRAGLAETFAAGWPYGTRLRITAAGAAWLAGSVRGAYGTVLR